MTGKLLPPEAPQQVSQTKARVHDLERRLARPGARPLPYIAKFSLWGALYPSQSGIELHPLGARLVLAYAKLVTAGSTPTVIELQKNGAMFGVLTIVAGQRYAELVCDTGFSARGDDFQVEITSAGTGARTLTVYGIYDR